MGGEALLIALVGSAILSASLVNALFKRLGVPSLVGYLGLGILFGTANSQWQLMSEPARTAFGFLADVGVVALLFRVGLESRVSSLLESLPKATPIWLGNVAAAGLAGFGAAYLLGFSIVPSLVAATAMTATSVGVSVAAWQEENALKTGDGALLLDVAELDDISGVALMALLFAVLPILGQPQASLWQTLAAEGGLFLLKLAGFAAVCWLFSRFLEGRVVHLSARIEPSQGLMLIVVGIGLLIAALAGWLGFSLAIGALFAGFVFSGDPEAVKTESSFDDLYAFFTPFFFIGIGLQVNLGSLLSGFQIGAVLLLAAVAGKLVGAGLPALLVTPPPNALAIGLSMVPRAEIAMIVMHQARQFGNQVVPAPLFTGMVLVAAATCTFAPLLLRPVLRRSIGEDRGR
jgi:Kef-type K+ transport system membrane component KefB